MYDIAPRRNPSPEGTVKQHIKLLHDFNEIRDVGLGLIGTLSAPVLAASLNKDSFNCDACV